MNDIETLRKAADRLRGKADDAVLATGDEPWHFTGPNYCVDRAASTYSVWSTKHPSGADPHAVFVCDASAEEQAEYIASVHPGVGIAVADWLRLVASLLDDGFDPNTETVSALAVARAVLGEGRGTGRGQG